jgi:hypothetical protein
MRKLNWLFVILLFFTVGCFLSSARATEEKKAEPAKAAPKGKAEPVKKGSPGKGGEHKEAGRGEARHDLRGRHNYNHFTTHEREIWRGGH